MSVSQSFTPIPEKKKLKADINEPVMDELELYLQAAREDYDWLTLDQVVEQLLEDALKKDRAFRVWLKQQQKQASQQPLTTEKPEATNQQPLALNGQNNEPYHRSNQSRNPQ